VVLVAQFVPSAQVPVGMQLAGPGVKVLTQPGGSAGAVTPSKFSLKRVARPHIVAVGVAVAVAVAIAVAVEVAVGVAAAVAVAVAVAVEVAVGVGDPVLAKTKIELLVPVMEALTVSVAVTVWLPGVPRKTRKMPVPLVNVLSTGRLVPFPLLVLVKCTVPV
jgi:hypothetical protein